MMESSVCPAAPGSSARVPVPPPAAPTLGQGPGLGHHESWQRERAGTEEAETFQFSLSSLVWKIISGKKTVVSMLFPLGHNGDHPWCSHSSQRLMATGLLRVQLVA